MFFVLSKTLGVLIEPARLLLLALLGAAGLAVWGHLGQRRRLARIGSGALVALVGAWGVATVGQLGAWVVYGLEKQVPAPKHLPDEIAGIVVLGGGMNQGASQATGRPQLGPAGDRVAAGFRLARRYPEADLVYTGGSGQLGGGPKGATYARRWYRQAGISGARLTLDRQARNTWQNATRTAALLTPQPDERWLLVTSASHMWRARGAFAAAGWPPMIAYPVDRRVYRAPAPPGFAPARTLSHLSTAVHELAGIAVYGLTGRWQAGWDAVTR